MKFNVGDKVRVNDTYPIAEDASLSALEDPVGFVRAVNGDESWPFEVEIPGGDDELYLFDEDELDLVEEATE